MDYQSFIKNKERRFAGNGIAVELNDISDNLDVTQKITVQRALSKMQFGVFTDTGSGKTRMQLEVAAQIAKHLNKRTILFTPLAVAGQTMKEAHSLGYPASRENNDKIHIINYDQIDNINAADYGNVELDEGSILKNTEGAMKEKLISTFSNYDCKFSFSATPSPNDPMELGNQAEFLGIMSRNEMLATFFVHDGGDTNKWRLKGHAINKFYEWIAEWAIVWGKPSDLGDYSDKGYILPKLNYIEHRVTTPNQSLSFFNDLAISATEFNKELRRTKVERLEKAIEISKKIGKSPAIIWVKQNVEADYLMGCMPDATEVRGNDSKEQKESVLLGFAENKFPRLITKPRIAQYGLNWQNCHNHIFPSPDWSFESFYQCIRRSYRRRQKHPVNIHIIVTDTMADIVSSLKQKEIQWVAMVNDIIKIQKAKYV